MINSKKYFLGIFAVFGMQLVCGINLANAVPCEETLKAHWDEQNFFTSEDDDTNGTYRKGDKIKEIDMSIFTPIYHATTYEMALDKFPILAIGFVEKHGKDCKLAAVQLSNRRAMPQCIANYLIANNCDVSAFKNSGTSRQKNSRNSTSNQSSSSGSSSQSSKKANQQATNSQSSSNLSDDSKKKLNETFDLFNKAHSQKDYAKAFPALKILAANSQDKQLKASATTMLGEYYKYGRSIQKDEVKAQALFEQASLEGDPDADAHICENYEEGTGGVIKNHQTAIKFCTLAATKGNVIAMGKLGYLYHTGEGVKNSQLGNEWICKAAKQGNDNAISNAEKLKLNCN